MFLLAGPSFKSATVTPPVTKQTDTGNATTNSCCCNVMNAMSLHHFCYFSAAAPQAVQSQVGAGIAVSKLLPAVGGHPAPESGQTHLAVSVWVHVTA